MNFAVLPVSIFSEGLQTMWQHASPASRDVHWAPAYGRAMKILGGSPTIAVMADGKNVLAKPFLVRPLPNGRSDIAGPYQYGGLFGDKRMVGDFERRFDEWIIANRIVSEFYLSPANDTPDCIRVKNVVRLPVQEPDAWRMSHGRRHATAKARRMGVEAYEVEPVTMGEVAAFTHLYAKTMMRRDAASRWVHSTEYFARLLGEMNDNAALIFSRTDGTVHTGAVILFGGKTAYYHYAASDTAVPTGAGDLVILEAARIAAERGCEWLHLGGGLSANPDDSLLAYKASFGGELSPVFMRRRIFDLSAYDRLTSEAGTMGAEFFPAYRAKEAA